MESTISTKDLKAKLVACRGANITRLRIWSSKRYLLNCIRASTVSLCRIRSNEITATVH
jgi:hypothetical protein